MDPIQVICQVQGPRWWVAPLTALGGAVVGAGVAFLVMWRNQMFAREQDDRRLQRQALFERLRDQRGALDIIVRYNRETHLDSGKQAVRRDDWYAALRVFDQDWSREVRSELDRAHDPPDSTRPYLRAIETTMREFVEGTEKSLKLEPPKDPKPRFRELLDELKKEPR